MLPEAVRGGRHRDARGPPAPDTEAFERRRTLRGLHGLRWPHWDLDTEVLANCGSNHVRVCAEVEQDTRGHSLILPCEPEQDVFRADVLVPKRERLAQREFEHFLAARRERNLSNGGLVALSNEPGDLATYLLEANSERREHLARNALRVPQQPEQKVLGADVVVLERPGFVLREDDDLPGPLGEA